MEMKYLVIFLIGSLIFLSAFLLFREFTGLHKKVDDLGKRMKKLEEASCKRLPFKAYDETLDAMAALDALEHAEDFRQILIQNAKAHLIKSMTVGTKKGE